MSAEEDENMSSDDENDTKNEEEITQLKVDLQADPFLYDKYVRLIELLSQAGELEDLRRIRETFAKYYPLSAELWLAWLADEQRLASSPEEKAQVNDLFEKATQDYNSVKVWYEFCQFSLWQLGQGSPEDMSSAVQSIRNIFERAVVAAGVNAAQGNLIWETYREFENSLLSMNRSQEQVSKVERLFKRQLAVPLLGMEQTLAEYQEWLDQRSQDLDPNVLRTYKSALELLRPRESLEDRLADLQQNDHNQQEDKRGNKLKRQESLYQVYEEYIALELKEGNPVRIQNIYERRINDHCLEADAWIQYVSYLENNLKDHQAAKQVLMRATRNCPWSGVIWIKLLRSCERLKCPSEDVVKVMEDALQSGLASAQDYTNVWLAFIDYRRRQLTDESEEEYDKMREVFQRALEQLASMIDGDPECKVARYWASLEADHFGSMDRARRIWGEILSGPISDQGQFWLEYITLEKMFGDTKHLKKLLPRAFQKTVDSPRLIGEVWLQFEREEGTLESYEDVEEIVFNRWQSIQDDKVKEKVETPKKEAVANRKPSRKRKNNADETTEQPAFKKPMVPKKDKKNESSAKKEDSSTQNSCVKPPPGFKRDVQPPPGFKSDPVMPSPPPGFKPDVQQPQEEGQIKASGQNTIFLSNLDFAVNEEKIKEVMSSSGEVLDVRLVKNYSGKSKGFAYVHFGTSEAVRGALQRDNEGTFILFPFFYAFYKICFIVS